MAAKKGAKGAKKGGKKAAHKPAKSQQPLLKESITIVRTYETKADEKRKTSRFTVPAGRMERARHERDVTRDNKRTALPPGKRVSRNGKVYYEHRENRSDFKRDYSAALRWKAAHPAKPKTAKKGGKKSGKKTGARKGRK